jgi:hypothetical protein
LKNPLLATAAGCIEIKFLVATRQFTFFGITALIQLLRQMGGYLRQLNFKMVSFSVFVASVASLAFDGAGFVDHEALRVAVPIRQTRQLTLVSPLSCDDNYGKKSVRWRLLADKTIGTIVPIRSERTAVAALLG